MASLVNNGTRPHPTGLVPAPQKARVFAIVGPTAVGKTETGVRLAEQIGAEIVSIDSGAVYRGMDLGTAKPSPDQLERVPHHMIDVAPPSASVTVAQFQATARIAIEDILGRGLRPLLVGGSGLHFRAVVDSLEFPPTDPAVRARLTGLCERTGGPESLYSELRRADPDAALQIDPANHRRIVRALEVIEVTGRRFSDFGLRWKSYESIYDLWVAGMTVGRSTLDALINERVDHMFGAGLVEEVRALEVSGYRGSLTSVQALGYAQVLAYLDGRVTMSQAIQETKNKTRRFARRQLTWFKADPRVKWFESDPAGLAEYLAGAVDVEASYASGLS